MLFSDEIIDVVASVLQTHRLPLVVDPVMVATSGDRLLAEAAHQRMVSALFPLATIITPNIPEASVLVRPSVRRTERHSLGWLTALCQRL